MESQLLHLSHDVTRIEVVENAHEFPKIDVRHSQIATNDQHIFIVGVLGWSAEIGRARHNNRVVP